MTASYKKMVIDEVLFKRLIRISEGITIFDEALLVDAIHEVVHKGNDLEHEITFDHFRKRRLPIV